MTAARDKVRKLLALANRPGSIGEGETALAMAVKLSAKGQLELEQVDGEWRIVGDVVETVEIRVTWVGRKHPWNLWEPERLASYLRAHPTVADRVWTWDQRMPREKRDAFIRRILGC